MNTQNFFDSQCQHVKVLIMTMQIFSRHDNHHVRHLSLVRTLANICYWQERQRLFDLMMEIEVTLRDHQSHYKSSKGEYGHLHHVSWQSI